MNYDFEVYKLSNDFFNDYPISKYPELLTKDGRPYNCLLIDTHIDYFICVPFRTNISPHNNDSYKFKNSNRSKKSTSGLDYQKMLIIKESRYLEDNAIVDRDEYSEAISNINQIVVGSEKYLNTYINHVNQTQVLHQREYDRHYKFSTLPYFHDVLNIPNIQDIK